MRLKNDDRGVTLPEVLVALSILAVIIMPLSDALIGFIRHTDATTRRMIESHDLQIATAYFAQDVQNLGVRDWSTTAYALRQSIDNPSYPCTGAGTPVVRLAWDDPTSPTGDPVVIRVTYLVRDVGGEHQLRRLQCRGSATVESDVVVVHNLVGMPSPPVCVPMPCTGAGVNAPQRVTLTVTVQHPANSASITLTLTGQRRQS